MRTDTMLSESCIAMEWTTRRCRLYSAPSSSASCSMHQVHGGGFSTAAERHRINAFIRRSARCRFVPLDLPSFETHCCTADEKLIKNIRFLPLPSHASQNYHIRPRSHNFELPGRSSHLTVCNFITRMLYADTY